MDEKKKQSFDEEFAPEISPGYRQDVHKQPKYKTLRFNGDYHFCRCIACAYHFRLFLMEGDLLYEETKFQSFKRIVKTEKGMQVIRFLLRNKSSKEIYILLKKNLVNKMKIFKIPQRTGDFLYRYLWYWFIFLFIVRTVFVLIP